MKRIACLILALALALAPLSVSAADLGSAISGAAFDVTVSAPTCYAKGDTVTVDVTVDNINVTNGLSYVEIKLNYNPAQLLLKNPLLAAEKELDCIVSTPSSDWENLSHAAMSNGALVNDGLCVLQALTVYMDSSTYAKEDGEIAFRLTFEVLVDSGDIELWVAHSGIRGATNTEAGFDLSSANGSSDVIKPHKFTNYVSDGNATATEDGTKTAVCDNGCGETDTVTDEGSATGPTALLGDVNFDGLINASDYTLIKRYVLKTYTFNELQLYAGDVNQDGKIDASDYTLIKRHVLGTYEIVQP